MKSKSSRRVPDNRPAIERLEDRRMLSVVTIGAGSPANTVSFQGSTVLSLSGPGDVTIPVPSSGVETSINAKRHTELLTDSNGLSVDTFSVTGTTAKSILKVKGMAELNSFTTSSPIGAIIGPGILLEGGTMTLPPYQSNVSVTAGGGIGKLVLGTLFLCDVSISGAPAAKPMAITLGGFARCTLATTLPIGSLVVQGGIGSSTIVLAGGAGPATDLGKLAANQIDDSTIMSSGSIGSISAASITNSEIYAGVTPADGATLPSTLGEFTSQSSIGSIKIGSTPNGQTGDFNSAEIAAFSMGKVNLGTVDFLNNNGTPFGIAATSIASLSGRNEFGVRFSLKRPTSQSAVTEQLSKEGLSLAGADLLISII